MYLRQKDQNPVANLLVGAQDWGPSQISLAPSAGGAHNPLPRGFYLAVRDALAERITLGLADGCVQADLASNRLQNPMLGQGLVSCCFWVPQNFHG